MVDINATNLRKDLNEILHYGQPVRFRFFNISGASAAYDDDVVLTQSGTDLWTSGLVQPIVIGGANQTRGSNEAVLVEQGKLLNDDLRVYVDGSVNLSGVWRVGIGSANPPTREYSLVPKGITSWPLDINSVYKKVFVRVLPTGSLIGE